MFRIKALFFLLLFSALFLAGRNVETRSVVGDEKELLNKADTSWVDSVFYSLTPRQRIAQLFFVSAYSKDTNVEKNIDELVKTENIGGLIFFQGTPFNEAKLTNYYQKNAKTPILISIDGEWGVAMRLDSAIKYPYQMTLGAIQNEDLIYEMGIKIGEQCNRLGIHLNYAPAVDVNNNSRNPVINFRSFGEDKYNVANKAISYMRGMQSKNVLASVKHFPGHGDTETDSHQGLPILPFDKKRLDSLEIYPFARLFKAGAKTAMVGHLQIPLLDSAKNSAASISRNVVKKILIDSLKFGGLILTDALNMNGVAKYNKPGQLEVKALLAGNDILLCSEKVRVAIDSIEQAIKDSVLLQSDIDYRCKKVLEAKYWSGLNKFKPIDLKNITSDINKPENFLLLRRLYEASSTVLINKNNILPIKNVDTLCIAALTISEKEPSSFLKMLNNYSPMSNVILQNDDFKNKKNSIKDTLIGNNLIIIGLHCKNVKASKNYGIGIETIAFIDSLAKEKNVILAVMGNPYVLKGFKNLNYLKGLVVGYQNEELTQEVLAQVIFGAVKVSGKLPVSISYDFPVGSGLDMDEIIRLKYTIPEDVGIASVDLEKIDSIALNGINQKAYPGCQILVAKDGKVIYKRSFGFHTYDVKEPVRSNDLYDIASVTKLAATTISMMMLDDQKKIHTDDYLSKYITLPSNSTLFETDLKSMLSHNARLTPWIPFYKDYFLKSDSVRNTFISKVPKPGMTLRIADSMFVANTFKDSVYQHIFHSKLLHKEEYKYSDLGFYLLKEVVEAKSGKTLDTYVSDNYYKSLGLTTIGFNPIDKFDKKRLIPTENDKEFRKQQIHGFVHDQGAAMLGGVSGHAGLFSNANDLAVIMQMLLNNGTYGGMRFFDEDIMKKYNSRHFESLGNRRGFGFDKPSIGGGGPVSELASDKSFGHSGFTGTIVWADPEYNLVYIFLSNRVYTDAENNKLRDMNIRTEIQKVIYEAILKSKLKN